MRIRKRFPPSSSLSSLPHLLDLQLNRSPVVQQRLPEANAGSQPADLPNRTTPQPSSDPNPTTIGSGSPRWVFSHKPKEVKEDRWEEKSTDTITRKRSISGAEVGSTGFLPPTTTASSCSSHQEVGRRYEEDKDVLPLKKRRGSFEAIADHTHEYSGGDNAVIIMEPTAKKATEKMKSKTNKKCAAAMPNVGSKDNETGEKEDGVVVTAAGAGTTSNNAKPKVKRGNVIMEGSRCSRVNGRGWRCCQQTLVGYSLCEHHLGKGRLRSMTSVRSRAAASAAATSSTAAFAVPAVKEDESAHKLSTTLLLSSVHVQVERIGGRLDHEEEEDDDDWEEACSSDEKKPLVIAKKRMKLGHVVKARSMSSLMGQTDNISGVVVGAGSNKNSGV